MTAVTKVAIAGSGVAGLATAIQLAKGGVEVHVFESKPELSALGSGITLQGNALRAFAALGVWEDVRRKGYFFEGLTLRAPGPDAPVVAELPEVKTGGPDFPATGGMYRPDLARILLDHALAAGANVRFGAKVTGVAETEGGVAVEVDGSLRKLTQCVYCPTRFTRPARYREHLLSTHGIGERIRCLFPGCTETFVRSEYLRRHEFMQHRSKARADGVNGIGGAGKPA